MRDTPAENLLAETPMTLALMRLGRQSAERKRISEIIARTFLRVCKILNVFQKKTAGKLAFYEFVYSLSGPYSNGPQL
jgi:hypothetical protein